jgi:hypothetical protein
MVILDFTNYTVTVTKPICNCGSKSVRQERGRRQRCVRCGKFRRAIAYTPPKRYYKL